MALPEMGVTLLCDQIRMAFLKVALVWAAAGALVLSLLSAHGLPADEWQERTPSSAGQDAFRSFDDAAESTLCLASDPLMCVSVVACGDHQCSTSDALDDGS